MSLAFAGHVSVARLNYGAADASADEVRHGLIQLLPHLESYARSIAPQRADAKDLVQETCRRALEASARFSAGTDLRAWLFCILRNLHHDHQRRARTLLAGDDPDHLAPIREPRPGWTTVSDDAVSRAIESLPGPYRTVYSLYGLRRLSYNQIASELRISVNTVGIRIHRARGMLREILSR